MLYGKDHWAANVLLKQRPSRKKRYCPHAAQQKTDKLLWARFAITADDVTFRILFLPTLVPIGRKKSKLRSATLHIRAHYTAKQMVLKRIEEDLAFLNTSHC
jgi:hypothetical protein